MVADRATPHKGCACLARWNQQNQEHYDDGDGRSSQKVHIGMHAMVKALTRLFW